MDPRISWLRSFVAVAEELHFRTAATKLHLSTSAISRHIQQLEDGIGAPLFRRTSRAVHLTPAGRRLYADLQGPLDAVTRALETATESDDGVVAVAYTGAAATHLIPNFIATWGARHTSALQLLPAGSGMQLDGLIDGTIDVGVHWEGPRSDRFAVTHLLTEPMYIALPADHRCAGADEVPLHELSGEVWLMAADSSDLVVRTAFIERCERQGFVPTIRSAANGNQAQLALVQAGHGLCLVPSQATGQPIDGVVFLRLRGERSQMVAVARAPMAARCREVVDVLRAAAQSSSESEVMRSKSASG